MNYGRILDKNRLLVMCECVGEIKAGGHTYEMLTELRGNPAIRNKTNGKTFVLGWEDIFALAQLAGIDEAETDD